MAVLKADFTFKLDPIKKLISLVPELNGRFLSFVGKRARTLLKKDFLSGQDITLRKYPTDANGKNTITSDVNKKRTAVKIYSYPVNLFERGRTLRSGRKEQGKFIITKKLKAAVLANMVKYTNDFEKIVDQELQRIDAK